MSFFSRLFDWSSPVPDVAVAPIPAVVVGPTTLPPPTLSALALASTLIAGFEGFRPVPYLDSAGIWTIGIGSIRWNGLEVTAATLPVTQAQALAAMSAELAPMAAGVDALVRVPVQAYQSAALYSFVYNVGLSSLASSTLLVRLNAGDYAGAADQFAVWNKAHVNGVLTEIRGLTIRRAREAAVFGGAV